MTTNHIDTLTEWWEAAEDAPASPGDSIIERHVCERDQDTHYTIGVHREGMRGLIGKSGTRILARAPKPKPAWHDAKAVIARYENSDTPQTFLRAGHLWIDRNGGKYTIDVLRDVTPLIEAKVTQPMIDRARAESMKWDFGGMSGNAVDSMITAALGLGSV